MTTTGRKTTVRGSLRTRKSRFVDIFRTTPPKTVSLAHMSLRYPPLEQFVGRFRSLLAKRSRFDFESELGDLSRVEQAVAFLALLELGRLGEIAISQAAPFAPIRVERRTRERSPAWKSARSA